MGHRFLGIALRHAHFLPIRRMPSDGCIDCAAVLPERTANDGFVSPGHGVILQLGRQNPVGKVVFCHRQKPGGVLVDAVDDARAKLPIDAGKLVA